MRSVLTVFGTRPEVIKLAPVIHALEKREGELRCINVSSSQHNQLLYPFVRQLNVRIDHDLAVMTNNQSPTDVFCRVLERLSPILERERPALVIVQGDTTTAAAAATAASYAKVPVGHVEAGLRTGNKYSPFPEEMNRRLISQLSDIHFASTAQNVATLIREGVPADAILLTGNPVVDSLKSILRQGPASPEVNGLLDSLAGTRLIVVTMHRRENAGQVMTGHLRALRRFVEEHDDVSVVFPVHPNPSVNAVAHAELDGAPRFHLIAPLDYQDFVHLLSKAWLIASDSGGIQEEAPTLGVPLLILRESTERPEVVDCGVGRLVGTDGDTFGAMLTDAYGDWAWSSTARLNSNPFGAGDAGERIASGVQAFLYRELVIPPAPMKAAEGEHA